MAAGKKGVKAFWKNILPTTLTSLATCSSAACIPVNITVAKKIGVSDDIAEAVIPMGTSFHKDGSIIGSVFKIMFLVYLFEGGISGAFRLFKVPSICPYFDLNCASLLSICRSRVAIFVSEDLILVLRVAFLFAIIPPL